MTSYPIVAQYKLDHPVKRGPLGLGRRRTSSEIPKIKPHEVLVWRVGSRYVVDAGQLQESDETVVRASSVSVVSVRPSSEVEVSFQIDSEDAAEFTVKVTFICSVLEPVVVVRDGQVDAAGALLAYLRGYQDLLAVGLEHPISEVNKVRTKMAVQIKSYMALRPPTIPGIEVTSATVQVETPGALGKVREISNEQQIELEKKKQKSEALMDAEWQSHLLAKAADFREAVGSDPSNAIGYKADIEDLIRRMRGDADADPGEVARDHASSTQGGVDSQHTDVNISTGMPSHVDVGVCAGRNEGVKVGIDGVGVDVLVVVDLCFGDVEDKVRAAGYSLDRAGEVVLEAEQVLVVRCRYLVVRSPAAGGAIARLPAVHSMRRLLRRSMTSGLRMWSCSGSRYS